MQTATAPNITTSLLEVIKKAGAAILEVYAADFSVEQKADKSPLTLADRRSHQILDAYLRSAYPFPVMSEEGKDITYAERREWQNFWLLDPLDGTKEFIKKNGEFTINIALIHDGRPVFGIVYVPVTDVLYYASIGEGAFRIEQGETIRLLPSPPSQRLRIVGSRSHQSPEFAAYVAAAEQRHGAGEVVSAGSALKFCLLAEGKADIYPRLGPTMEWDTAAGQIVVEEAGGRVREAGSGQPLGYNKQSLVNPHFIAVRSDDYA